MKVIQLFPKRKDLLAEEWERGLRREAVVDVAVVVLVMAPMFGYFLALLWRAAQ